MDAPHPQRQALSTIDRNLQLCSYAAAGLTQVISARRDDTLKCGQAKGITCGLAILIVLVRC